MVMLTHSTALWRIVYRTDLARPGGEILPLGFALEARWSNDVRWLGMLFRKRLEVLETELVDLATWSELTNLDKFMKGLFDQAWSQPLDDGDTVLGSSLLSANYSMRSSLQFMSDDASVVLNNEDPEESFPTLYGRLLNLHSRLRPTVTAPVIQMPFRQSPPTAPATPQKADVKHEVLAA
jgi:hypothetical protein